MARTRKRKAVALRPATVSDLSDDDLDSRHFVKATAADRYLTYQSLTLRRAHISDARFPDLFSKPFTKSSFFSAQSSQDLPYFRQSHDQWIAELENRFNLLFYGAGSKRHILEELAQTLTTKGEVLVFDAFRNDVEIGVEEVLRGLEMVKENWEQSNSTKVKGKGKARLQTDEESVKVAITPLPNSSQSQEAFQRRLRSLVEFFHANKESKSVYLVFHSLTLSQNLTSPFALEVLLQLSNCPNFHLIISVDDALGRWACLFDTRHRFGSYCFSHGPSRRDEEEVQVNSDDDAEPPVPPVHYISFNFVHHHIPTFSSFSLETFHSGLLASLFPSGNIISKEEFPTSRLFTKKKPKRFTLRAQEDYGEYSSEDDVDDGGQDLTSRVDGSQSKSSLLSILRSVTTRSQSIFVLLAESQLNVPPPQKPSKSKIPRYSLPMYELLTMAEELFLSLSEKQFQALVSEFRDHGVFKEADGMVWIPMIESDGAGDDENGTQRKVLTQVVKEVKRWKG